MSEKMPAEKKRMKPGGNWVPVKINEKGDILMAQEHHAKAIKIMTRELGKLGFPDGTTPNDVGFLSKYLENALKIGVPGLLTMARASKPTYDALKEQQPGAAERLLQADREVMKALGLGEHSLYDIITNPELEGLKKELEKQNFLALEEHAKNWREENA